MSSSTIKTSNNYISEIVNANTSSANSRQKQECLKLLKVVVKNLADATKSKDPKYRQLRLTNEKVQKKLLPCPSAIPYLKSIGFTETTDDDGSQFLRIEPNVEVNIDKMSTSLEEIDRALHIITQEDPLFSEEKKTPEGITIPSGSSIVKSTIPTKLSEKQKARLLQEKKRQREAEQAKEERMRNVAMLKQDKYVRKNDANWKSGVSAACQKSGDSIKTFRDRHGE